MFFFLFKGVWSSLKSIKEWSIVRAFERKIFLSSRKPLSNIVMKNWSRFPSPNSRKYHVIRMWLVNGLEFHRQGSQHKTGCVQNQKIKQTDLDCFEKRLSKQKEFVLYNSGTICNIMFEWSNFHIPKLVSWNRGKPKSILFHNAMELIKPTRTLTSKSILVAMFKNRGFNVKYNHIVDCFLLKI